MNVHSIIINWHQTKWHLYNQHLSLEIDQHNPANVHTAHPAPASGQTMSDVVKILPDFIVTSHTRTTSWVNVPMEEKSKTAHSLITI